MMAILLLLLLAATLLVIRYFRFYWFLYKLPYAKGVPLLGHTINFWPGYDVYLKKILELINDADNQRTIRKDGFFAVWLGPVPFVFIHNIEDIQEILISNSLTVKGFPYKFFKDWLGQGIFTSDGPHHHNHRKLITPAFHFKILEKYVSIFNSNINTLLNLMDEKVGKGNFDIEQYLNNVALDIIAELAMGVKINAQTEDSPYANAVHELTELITDRGCKPLLYPDFIFNLTRSGKKYNKSLELINNFTNDLIKKGKNERNITQPRNNIPSENEIGEKEKVAFIDIMLETHKTSPDFTEKDVKDEVNTIMFGGHDTVAPALCFIFHLLGKNPSVQEEILNEIESVVGEDEFTYNNLQELKYLERVIKESLRKYPVVPIIFRQAAKDFKLKSGYILPKGAQILLFLYYLHNDPALHPNPDIFDPDRFLPENCSERHQFDFLPFSAGPRNCIGQKLGILEVKAVVAAAVRRFRIISTGDVRPIIKVVLQPSNGINVILERRYDRGMPRP